MKKVSAIVISVALILIIILYSLNRKALLNARQAILTPQKTKNLEKTANENLKSGKLYTNDGDYYGTYIEKKDKNQLIRKEKNGYGVLKLKNNDRVLGIWKNDELIKQEEYIYSNGDKYWGNFVEHKREKTFLDIMIDNMKDSDQKEKLKKEYGLVDKGKYEAGWKDGYGKYINSEGEIYIGNFKNDTFDKDGTIIQKDGSKLYFESNKNRYNLVFTSVNRTKVKFNLKSSDKGIESAFKKYGSKFKDTIVSQTKDSITYKYGNKYVGKINNKKKNGKGILYSFGRKEFEGNFINDKKNGDGILTAFDGSKFIGQFKNDIFDEGKANAFEGNIYYSVSLKDGKFEGKGKWISGNGTYYSGEFKNGQFDGYGIFALSDGTIYEGNFKNNTFEGEGTVCFPKKENDIEYDEFYLNSTVTQYGIYRKGNWKNGELDGTIITAYPGGKITEEKYENGIKISSEEKSNYTIDDLNKKNGVGKTLNYNKENGFGETKNYIGLWKNSEFNGVGVYTTNFNNLDDYKYTGEFKNGKKDGYGIIDYIKGDKYYGNWKNGKKEGIGKFYYSDGSFYKGEWKNNKYDGYGVFVYSNGDRYIGDFKDGKKDGHGFEIYANGIFEGEFKNDNPIKTNSYTVKNKTILYPNGDKYIGDFNHERKDGYGTYVFKDGRKYEGNWRNDKYQGKGTFSWKNGDKIEGDFINNRIVRENCIYYFADGNKYTGEFNNDFTKGKGTFYFSTGDKFEGNWNNNKFNGKGVFTWKNGDKFEGKFIDNKMNIGTYYFINGKKVNVNENNY